MQKVCCSVLDTLVQRLVLPCLNGFGGARHHIVGSPVKGPMCVVLEGDLLRIAKSTPNETATLPSSGADLHK